MADAGPPPGAAPAPALDLSDAGRVSRGLVAAWERQCRLVPGAALYRHDGLVVVADPGGPVSGVVLVELAPLDPRLALEVVEGLCAAHSTSAVVEAPGGAHPGVEAALAEAGYRPVRCRAAMVSDLGLRVVPATLPSAGVRLRPAGVGDLDALAALEVACFGLAPAMAARTLSAAALADPAWATMVADQGRVVAKAHGHHHDGGVGILGVATTPAARRRGLAGALVGRLLDAAASAGCQHAWLLSEPGATALYGRLGFRPAADWLTWAGG